MPPLRRIELRVAALVAVLSILAPTGRADEPTVYAIGDIHGAQGALHALLVSIGLVDDEDRWTGGDAVLVQTGDFLDRGDNAVPVARLLRRLQGEARAAGGRVEVLLGNHEALNLLARLDDVTPRILQAYVDEDSEDRRKAICRQQANRRRREAQNARRSDHSVEVPSKVVAFNRCIREHPLGLVEYVEDLGPEGDLGRWIRQLPVATRIADTVFLHGGISEAYADWDLDRINREVREEIDRYDLAREWMLRRDLILETDGMERIVATARALVSGPQGVAGPMPDQVRKVARLEEWLLAREDGPLWFRGYAHWEDAEGESRIGAILQALGARRIVAGHTPMPDGQIRIRFGGRVALIDTGMLAAAYHGLPTALEIVPGCLRQVHLDRKTPLVGCDSPSTVPEPPTPAG